MGRSTHCPDPRVGVDGCRRRAAPVWWRVFTARRSEPDMQRYLLLIFGSIILVALDQWSKVEAAARLALPDGKLPEAAEDIRTRLYVVSEGWFNFRLAGNKGAAWSIFRDMSEAYRVPFFVVLSAVAAVVIIHLYRKSETRLARWSLMLILGGAIGNLIDRVRLGYVVDFIQWHYGTFYWPTFNVADIGISCGVGLMIIDMIRQARSEAAARRATRPPPAA